MRVKKYMENMLLESCEYRVSTCFITLQKVINKYIFFHYKCALDLSKKIKKLPWNMYLNT